MHTDGNSHDLSYFDGQEEYTKVEVTEDTYAEQAAEGLYFFQGAYTVPSGVEKIVFRYYDEEGNILESDTVPVLSNGEKGDTGPAGEKGSGYRGVYTDTSAIDDAVKGDYILSSSDGKIWQYQLISGELQWVSLTVAEAPAYYNQALNDGIKTFASGTSNEMMSAITAWCQSLVAQAAFITNLFSKQITIADEGYIQNSGYDGTKKGFKLQGDGTFNCVDGVFNGTLNCGNFKVRNTEWYTILGDYESGYQINPSSNDEEATCLLGRICAVFGLTVPNYSSAIYGAVLEGATVSDINSAGGYFLYNNVKYKYIDLKFVIGSSGRPVAAPYSFYLRFYNSESDSVTLIDVDTYAYSGMWVWDIEYTEAEIVIKVDPEASSLMCNMEGLPTLKPDQSGIVYKNGNYLMIS